MIVDEKTVTDSVKDTTSDFYFIVEDLETDISERLRSLDLTQSSIETSSDYLLNQELPQGLTTDFLVDLLVRFITRVNRQKKLPYIYLANDLIQKSIIRKKKATSNFNNFHEALAPPKINTIFEKMFRLLADSENYGQAEI